MANRIIVPSITTTRRNAVTPVAGDLVYDTDTNEYYGGVSDGTTVTWQELGSGGGGGGGTTPVTPPHAGARITVSRTTGAAEATAGTTYNAAYSVSINTADGFEITDITGASTSQGTVTVTDSTFTLSVPTPVAGRITVNFNVNYRNTDANTDHTETRTVSIGVGSLWYAGVLADTPEDISELTSAGIYSSPETFTYTTTDTVTDVAYAALPTRATGYTFQSGVLFLDAVALTGTFTTGYTLYQINDVINGVEGRTLIVNITEA